MAMSPKVHINTIDLSSPCTTDFTPAPTPIGYPENYVNGIDLSCQEGMKLKDFLDSHRYLTIVKIGIFGGPGMAYSYNCITIMDSERNHIVCDINEQLPDYDMYDIALSYLKDYVDIICKEK